VHYHTVRDSQTEQTLILYLAPPSFVPLRYSRAIPVNSVHSEIMAAAAASAAALDPSNSTKNTLKLENVDLPLPLHRGIPLAN
jgi:hypothetical protein